MTAHITAQTNSASASYATPDPHSVPAENPRESADAPSQARAVVTVREPFNPLGAGLRSIWPQSVVGF
ncbi:hypothetical protein [Paenarthrobacter sp. NPDC089316]|uniref:hypothetical protein n=1 Tax=unclassified Paenarthrobacter TaxID=2634190 RepID=UPI0034395FFA